MVLFRGTWLFLFFSYFLSIPAINADSSAPTTPSFASPAFQASSVVTIEALEQAIAERRYRVAEFQFLKEWAEQSGIPVFLAGGTAAGLAHYVYQHLEHEAAKKAGLPSPYREAGFSYTYYDLYRSTQDFDIVIDGTNEDALALETALAEKFPHLQEGNRSVWEVRLLRQPRGPEGPGRKDPLLGFDFLHQHSDSHSTGLVQLGGAMPKEYGAKTSGERFPIVLDLRQWGASGPSQFLKDVHSRELHYYFSPEHAQTKRAKAGSNPPILSVVRYFTKAFQYGLNMRTEDLEKIKKILEAFVITDPQYRESYVAKQICSNGLKLFKHAQDLERAWDEMDRIGLRHKLIAFGSQLGNEKGQELALWLNKKPLRSWPVGRPLENKGDQPYSGKTAQELGIRRVVHATRSFESFKGIIPLLGTKLRAFVSRENKEKEGEFAVHGEGFYVFVDSGLFFEDRPFAIVFDLDPNAREEVDFRWVPELNYLVILNGAVLKFAGQGEKVDPLQYFQLLAGTESARLSKGTLLQLEQKINAELSIKPAGDPVLTALVQFIQKGNRDWLASDYHSNWIQALERWTALTRFNQYLQDYHWEPEDYFAFLVAIRKKDLFPSAAVEQEKRDAILTGMRQQQGQVVALVQRQVQSWLRSVGDRVPSVVLEWTGFPEFTSYLDQYSWGLMDYIAFAEALSQRQELLTTKASVAVHEKLRQKIFELDPNAPEALQFYTYFCEKEHVETMSFRYRFLRYELSQVKWMGSLVVAELLKRLAVTTVIRDQSSMQHALLEELLGQTHWGSSAVGAEVLLLALQSLQDRNEETDWLQYALLSRPGILQNQQMWAFCGNRQPTLELLLRGLKHNRNQQSNGLNKLLDSCSQFLKF